MSECLLAGANSRISPSRLDTTSWEKKLTPVALPPGRVTLTTSPSATGSCGTAKTIGIVLVAAFAATAEAEFVATINATSRSADLLVRDRRRDQESLQEIGAQWHPDLRPCGSVLYNPEIKAWYLKLGAELGASSPDELGAAVQQEMIKWAKIANDIGIERN